jgi:hypothetical protein
MVFWVATLVLNLGFKVSLNFIFLAIMEFLSMITDMKLFKSFVKSGIEILVVSMVWFIFFQISGCFHFASWFKVRIQNWWVEKSPKQPVLQVVKSVILVISNQGKWQCTLSNIKWHVQVISNEGKASREHLSTPINGEEGPKKGSNGPSQCIGEVTFICFACNFINRYAL